MFSWKFLSKTLSDYGFRFFAFLLYRMGWVPLCFSSAFVALSRNKSVISAPSAGMPLPWKVLIVWVVLHFLFLERDEMSFINSCKHFLNAVTTFFFHCRDNTASTIWFVYLIPFSSWSKTNLASASTFIC